MYAEDDGWGKCGSNDELASLIGELDTFVEGEPLLVSGDCVPAEAEPN